jgi:GNAT superfamily N-acetyltransferase
MLSIPMEIRKATLEDAAELARLRWEFSPDEVQATDQTLEAFAQGFGDFMRRGLESGGWVIWVGVGDERILANIYVHCVTKVPRPGLFGKCLGYMTNVYVESEYRNRGIGSALLEHVVAWARQQGIELLIVWPSEASQTFYQRFGFKRSAEAMELDLSEEEYS